MDKRVFFIMTLAVLISLFYFYMRKNFTPYRVKVEGDPGFVEEVVEGLKRAKLRFELVKDSDIVFSQRRKTLTIGGKVYHLTWSEEIFEDIEKELVLSGEDLSGVVIRPYPDPETVFEKSADLIRKGFSDGFENGYLAVPVEVIDASGNTLFLYDPVKGVFRR